MVVFTIQTHFRIKKPFLEIAVDVLFFPTLLSMLTNSDSLFFHYTRIVVYFKNIGYRKNCRKRV